jgi:hypothetical protein
LTGRGADVIIIDDPLKPTNAMSETRRVSVNEWYDTTRTLLLTRSYCVVERFRLASAPDFV